jgi:hypothetical protein
MGWGEEGFTRRFMMVSRDDDERTDIGRRPDVIDDGIGIA